MTTFASGSRLLASIRALLASPRDFVEGPLDSRFTAVGFEERSRAKVKGKNKGEDKGKGKEQWCRLSLRARDHRAGGADGLRSEAIQARTCGLWWQRRASPWFARLRCAVT